MALESELQVKCYGFVQMAVVVAPISFLASLVRSRFFIVIVDPAFLVFVRFTESKTSCRSCVPCCFVLAAVLVSFFLLNIWVELGFINV